MKRAIALFAFVIVLSACGPVESGRGWELLAFSRSGPIYTVLLAQSQDDIDRIWTRFSLPLQKPAVDFDSQVLIGLGHGVSSSCPEIEFKGLAIDGDHVYGKYRIGSFRLTGGCTLDATSAMFWLAVDRDRLPDQFTLSVTEDGICRGAGCPQEALQVDLADPDQPAPWWAESRLGLTLFGQPVGHYLIETEPVTGFGNPAMYIPPDGGGWFRPGQVAMSFEHGIPSRVDVYSATCPDNSLCGDGQGFTKDAHLCGVDIVLRERADSTVTVTLHADGSCTAALEDGLDWPH